jgi:hypothetical protein
MLSSFMAAILRSYYSVTGIKEDDCFPQNPTLLVHTVFLAYLKLKTGY